MITRSIAAFHQKGRGLQPLFATPRRFVRTGELPAQAIGKKLNRGARQCRLGEMGLGSEDDLVGARMNAINLCDGIGQIASGSLGEPRKKSQAGALLLWRWV